MGLEKKISIQILPKFLLLIFRKSQKGSKLYLHPFKSARQYLKRGAKITLPPTHTHGLDRLLRTVKDISRVVVLAYPASLQSWGGAYGWLVVVALGCVKSIPYQTQLQFTSGCAEISWDFNNFSLSRYI